VVEKTGKMGKSKRKVAEGIIYEMEIQYPTYYTYHTLSCSDNFVKLEINENNLCGVPRYTLYNELLCLQDIPQMMPHQHNNQH
jgi:hypothetical protein